MRIIPQSVGIVHFVGIGGIGMSGIAEVLHTLGYSVRGSDISENSNVQRLKLLGIPIYIGHDAAHVQDAAVVVISSAVKSENAEVKMARQLHLPIVKRAEMLAELMRLKPSIAVAGTHGKTSTTSLGAAVLESGGLDPTVVSGGIINAYGTNAKLGTGEWIIVEADESDGSFIKLPATIAIVTNIDLDHMEHYGSFDILKQAFVTFIENLPFYGLGILCFDHPEVRSLLPLLSDRRIVTYGLEEGADIRATHIILDGHYSKFNVEISPHFHRLCKNAPQINRLEHLQLSMLGLHNVQNSLSVIAMALELGMTPDQIQQGLTSFKGVGRRFTQVDEVQGIKIIDDYAHHPAEIRVVLKTGRIVSKGQIIAVMQPHRYSRLADLYQDFCTCFDDADHIIITPIYAAGEQIRTEMTHIRFAQDIKSFFKANSTKSVYTIDESSELAPLIYQLATTGDIVICMGAGSITNWAYELPKNINKVSSAYEEMKNEEIKGRRA